MDSRVKELGKDQRIALVRIVYDLVMADKIIDEQEIAKFVDLFGKKDNHALFRTAQELSFSQAVKLLNQPLTSSANDYGEAFQSAKREKELEIIKDIINEIARSDGFCAPAEAILLVALDYFLWKNDANRTRYDVQSFKLTDIFIGKRFVLYVEDKTNSKTIEVEKDYDLITNLLASIGFQFVYVPKLVEQYKQKTRFEEIALYIFPDIPEERVDEVYTKIKNMGTRSFIKDHLNKVLGFDIVCSQPSLMVMLGRSSVIGKDISDKGIAYDTYANFLKIKIGDDNVLDIIGDLVHNFNQFASFNFQFDFNPAKNKLLYSGMHRAFFRLVALAKNTSRRYIITINTTLGAVFINDKKLNLSRGRIAQYLMILCRAFFGQKKGLPMNNVFSKLDVGEQGRLENQYEWVCQQVAAKQRRPLYPIVSSRLSEIRDAIKDTVGNRLIGEIQVGIGDYVTTLVNPDFVFVNGVPILEHPEWKQIFSEL